MASPAETCVTLHQNLENPFGLVETTSLML